MTIDDFNVSEDCRLRLREVGFTAVEEIVEFLEQQAISRGMSAGRWVSCFDEIVEQIKLLGLWSDILEQGWPSTPQ